jgi:phosphoribosylamine--glycine ligase
VKASGLAAGKGVTVCKNNEEAKVAVAECLEKRRFGEAGGRWCSRSSSKARRCR